MWDRKMLCLLGLFSLLFFTSGLSQNKPDVTASLHPYDSVLIGDHVNLQLSTQFVKGFNVIWPAFADTQTNFEVIKVNNIDTVFENESFRLTQNITLSAYDSGVYYIFSIPFQFTNENGDTLNIYTPELALNVYTLEVDTAKPFKAIKPPIEVPYTLAEIWPWILAVIIALAIFSLAVYLWSKRSKVKKPAPLKRTITVPAHMVAYKKLDALEQKKLWQKDKLKEYYIELTCIIREYIENRYGIHALESTSDEILQDLKKGEGRLPNLDKLEMLLIRADFVKFAKFQPLADENVQSMEIARNFVKKTIPEIVESKNDLVNA